ncbi:MAG: ParB/RepB/Spo0J family partition protein, partial [Dehalococcoidia bacterium]|nr:ParB/RepB/Spo0J family partition protein [Dehalococcoidia bacterium]
PRQPRRLVEDAALLELAESVRQHGIIQPVVVTLPAGQTTGARIYHLIAGERRWRAAKLAGLTRVPVVVREATPQQVLEIALVENIQREDLSPLEEAAAYRHLGDDFGLTQEEIAGKVGKSRAAVANALRLLGLPEELKNALSAGAITEGHARAILGLATARQQVEALEVVIAKGLSVRQTEEIVRRLSKEGLAPSSLSPSIDPQTEEIEERFRSALGTRVQLLRSRKGGKLVVHFYSEEELQGLYEVIVRE